MSLTSSRRVAAAVEVTARLYTASWSGLHAANKAGRLEVQPVRISRGVPKFWPAAEAFPALEALMPDRSMFKLSSAAFWRAYVAKLERIGAEAVGRQLDELADRFEHPLALACFEKVGPDGLAHDCHRGPLGFAGWWGSQGRGEIPEFRLERAVPAQLALAVDPPRSSARDVFASGRPTHEGGIS